MTFEQTGTMLAMLTTVYTTRLMPTIDDAAIRVWAQLLADLDWKKVQAAVASHITTNKYPPTIAEIRERVTAACLPPMEPPEAAWKRINAAVVKYGYPAEDKAREALQGRVWDAVQRWGWKHFCEMDERDEMANYAQFRDAYLIGCKREQEAAQIPDGVQRALKMIGGGA
jgi:hypothetical protein